MKQDVSSNEIVDKYIKDIIAKKLCEYKSAEVKEGE